MALSDIGIVTHYVKFRHHVDTKLKTMYPRLIHVIRVAHMLARLASEILDNSSKFGARSIFKKLTKVSEAASNDKSGVRLEAKIHHSLL